MIDEVKKRVEDNLEKAKKNTDQGWQSSVIHLVWAQVCERTGNLVSQTIGNIAG